MPYGYAWNSDRKLKARMKTTAQYLWSIYGLPLIPFVKTKTRIINYLRYNYAMVRKTHTLALMNASRIGMTKQPPSSR